jgi:hypothetical protein
LAAEVAGHRAGRGTPGRIVVRGRQVGLSLRGDGIGGMDRSVGDHSGWEAGDRGARTDTQVPEIIEGPVLVTVLPANTAKDVAVPVTAGVSRRRPGGPNHGELPLPDGEGETAVPAARRDRRPKCSGSGAASMRRSPTESD